MSNERDPFGDEAPSLRPPTLPSPPPQPPTPRGAPEPPSPPEGPPAAIRSIEPGLPNGFTPHGGGVGDRLDAIERLLTHAWPHIAAAVMVVQNLELERTRSSEMLTYRCLGILPTGKVCGKQMQAKRPEHRTWEERLLCSNPEHGSDNQTPMEPILASA